MESFKRGFFGALGALGAICAFFIFGALVVIISVGYAHAETLTQEQVVNQFKDDQIECLKHKVSINEEIIKLVQDIGKLYIESQDTNNKNKLIKMSKQVVMKSKRLDTLFIIKNNGTYTCTDDDDDKFLDDLLGKDVEIDMSGNKVNI